MVIYKMNVPSIPQEIQDSVSSLYIVFFDRAPDADGFNYWCKEQVDDVSPFQQAANFVLSPEWTSQYDNLTATEQVELFYQNSFDRIADTDGLAYWVGSIDSGTPFSTIAYQIIWSANLGGEGINPNDTAIVRNKIAVSEYFAIDLASNDVAIALTAFDGVTQDPATVPIAEARLEEAVNPTPVPPVPPEPPIPPDPGPGPDTNPPVIKLFSVASPIDLSVASSEPGAAGLYVATAPNTLVGTVIPLAVADTVYRLPVVVSQTAVTQAVLKVSDTAGNITISPNQVFLGTNNPDAITGTTGVDFIFGFNSNDTINALDGNDVIMAGDGEDSITGGDGNDTITGGAGADVINAGTGANTITDAGVGADVIKHNSVGTVAIAVTGTDAVTLTASTVGATATVANGIAAEVNASTSTAAVTLTALAFASFNVTAVLTGGTGNDTITGANGNYTLTGGAGADSLTGRDGADTFAYAAAVNTSSDSYSTVKDTITDLVTTDFIVLNLTAVNNFEVSTDVTGTTNSYNASTNGDATLSDVGDVIIQTSSISLTDDQARAMTILNAVGTANADTISGGQNADTISGGDGNDTITGGAGADSLAGGAGVNTYIFNTGDVAAGETVTLTGTTDTFSVDTNTVFNAMNAGGAITGLDAINFGLAQNAEFLSAQLTGQTFAVNAAGGGVLIVDASANTGVTINLGLATLTIATSSITGGNGNDTITGTNAVDTITGGAGADVLTGGDGGDVIYANNNGNKAVFTPEVIAAGTGTITEVIITFNGYRAVAGSLNVDANNAADVATAYRNLVANDVNLNSLLSVTGTGDSLAFTSKIDGALAVPVLDYTGGSILLPTITIQTAGTAGSNDGNQIDGGTGADIIYGGAGADSLTGGAGADALIGGAGVDTFIYNAVVDTSSDSNSTVTDIITDLVATDFILLNLTEVNYFIMFQNVTAVANSYNASTNRDTDITDIGDVIIATPTIAMTDDQARAMTILNAVGTIGNDSIAGGQNTDTITGGDGNDFIAGFAGVDVLDGGAGIDTFILYTTSTNNDAITFVVADDILGMDKTSSGAFTAPGAPVLVQTLAGNTDVANRVVVDTIANLGAAGVTLGNLSAYANTVNYAVAFDTGAIFYDADGDWTAGSIAVGDLSSTTALTAGNFVIV